MRPATPSETRMIADNASEAIRALIHATLPADRSPGLRYPADACYLLGALQQLSSRIPQLLGQLSVFLQQQLQHDLVVVDEGPFVGDPIGSIGTACTELEGPATRAARRLAATLDAAQQAIAFASAVN